MGPESRSGAVIGADVGADGEDAPVETRYVGELVSGLTEARTELNARSAKPVTRDDERQFATAWLRAQLREINEQALTAGTTPLNNARVTSIIDQVLSTTFDATMLQRTWTEEFPDAQNLWVIGTERCRIQVADGSIVDGPVLAGSNAELERAVLLLRAQSSRPTAAWNRLSHQLEFVLREQATRVTAAKHTTGGDVFVTLRRATMAKLGLGDLVANGTIPAEVGEFLDACVKSRMRILVGGAMNAGKTVLLRALAASLDPDTPLVTVEAEAELMLKQHAGDPYPKWILELEALEAGLDGEGEVDLATLIRDAQRMSPGCVIVGEVRGEEALALSKAVNQGYQVLGSIHSANAIHAVRNAALYLEEYSGVATAAALERMSMGVDLAVYVEQSNGKRQIAEILDIGDVINGTLKAEPVYRLGKTPLTIQGTMYERFERFGIEI